MNLPPAFEGVRSSPVLLLNVGDPLRGKIGVFVPPEVGHAEVRDLRAETVTALAVDLRPDDALHDVEERWMAQ